MRSRSVLTLLFVPFLLLAACATAPSRPDVEITAARGERATQTALDMVGRPYKYQGDSPAGFDCSGLVRYSYLTAGRELPHGTTALRRLSHPVRVRDLRKGDLLFFDEAGKKYSHVALYAGEGRFVHAPSSGKTVRIDSLKDTYWKDHFLEARRL